MTSTQGFVRTKRQAITSRTTPLLLDGSKVFLLLIILQVVRMITASKDICDKSGAEILNSLKDWVSGYDVVASVKPWKDWFCFTLTRWRLAAVWPARWKQKCFEKSDWPYCRCYSDFELKARVFNGRWNFQGAERANLDHYDNYEVGQDGVFYGKWKKIKQYWKTFWMCLLTTWTWFLRLTNLGR